MPIGHNRAFLAGARIVPLTRHFAGNISSEIGYGRLIARAQAQRPIVEGERRCSGRRTPLTSALCAAPRYFFLREDLRRGTFAPFSRASLRPMAIACFRLFTLRPDPLFSVPFFLRCIADLTRLAAALPYLAMIAADAKAVLPAELVHHVLSD